MQHHRPSGECLLVAASFSVLRTLKVAALPLFVQLSAAAKVAAWGLLVLRTKVAAWGLLVVVCDVDATAPASLREVCAAHKVLRFLCTLLRKVCVKSINFLCASRVAE